MNRYAAEARSRKRCLLIVEGHHEKNELFRLVFECFPELDIDMDSVWIYGTNIYMLYEDIVKEYGCSWAEEGMDIDLPFVISKKESPDTVCYKNNFTDIILVFDYERHDPKFSEDKISEMQTCFSDSTDMGKLYLNYPMIESYLHLSALPDEEYIDRSVPVSLQPGEKYKRRVHKESAIENVVGLPHKIDDLLKKDPYNITDETKRRECCNSILDISDTQVKELLEEILHIVGDERKENTLKYQIQDWILKLGYVYENKTYFEYMRDVFREIVCHNICKAYKVQYDQKADKNLREQFGQLDLSRILDIQNEVSMDHEKGFVWVLSTCLFLIPDYNFKLIGEDDSVANWKGALCSK